MVAEAVDFILSSLLSSPSHGITFEQKNNSGPETRDDLVKELACPLSRYERFLKSMTRVKSSGTEIVKECQRGFLLFPGSKNYYVFEPEVALRFHSLHVTHE